MAHFARIEPSGIVSNVLVVPDKHEKNGETYLSVEMGLGGRWIQTSYNTFKNVHYNLDTGLPSGKAALRKNYAGIGYMYDEERDAFYPPKPIEEGEWVLDYETGAWYDENVGPEPDYEVE